MKRHYKSFQELTVNIPPTPADYGSVKNFPIGLSWNFTFGKYKQTDVTLEQAIEEDRDYVIWCIEHVRGFILTPEANDFFNTPLDNAGED